MSIGLKTLWGIAAVAGLGLLLFLILFTRMDHSARAERFSQDFEAQNREALSHEDGFALATRMSALVADSSFACIEGFRRGHAFFHDGDSPCKGGLLRATSEVRSQNGAILIRAVHRIPNSTWALIALSVFAAFALALLATLATRRSLRIRDAYEQEIRSLALQVAHDIRGPLLALKLNPSSRDALDSLDGIANHLLSKHRRQNCESTLNPVAVANSPREFFTHTGPVDLHHQVSTWLKSGEKRWSAAEIDIELLRGVHSSLSAADLEVILGNLLSNSIQAGSRRIQVLVEEGERGEQRLGVRDWGSGFSARMKERFTERGATEGKSSGNGLGLASIREWVARWGGRIELDPSVNNGALIWVGIGKRVSSAPE